jgi:hypothetical protein
VCECACLVLCVKVKSKGECCFILPIDIAKRNIATRCKPGDDAESIVAVLLPQFGQYV